ncbi:MAG: SCO family protein [Elusimicrobia bacterium]|nr:SCO family protein [Elusimicrobiota bacterium]
MRRSFALAVCLSLLASCRRPETASPPVLIEGATAWTLPDFSLKDDAGRTVAKADLLGKPWVAAFIYASCGSQCPMMTAKMKALRTMLPEAFLVSFSVDSADTPERLAAYKKTYGADWMFLTGPQGAVRGLCMDGFKLAVADGSDPKDPIIHSDKLVLVDRDARVRGFFDPSEPSHLSALAEALKSL